MNLTIRSHKLVNFLCYFAISFLSLGIISHTLKYDLGLLPDFYRWFNTDGEKNFPALFSSLLLMFAAVLLLVITVAKHQSRDRYTLSWGLLALIFCGLSADEWMSFHEKMTDVVGNSAVALPTQGIFHFAWIVVGIAFVAAVGLAYRNFLIALPRQYARLFLKAAALYISGAIGLEMAAGYYAENHQQWNRLVWLGFTTVEEGLEMFGIILFIYALLHYIQNVMGGLNLRHRAHQVLSQLRNASKPSL